MSAEIGRPFNRKLIVYLLVGFLIISVLGFVFMMSTNNPTEARRAKEEKEKLESVKSQQKGDPRAAKDITERAEQEALSQLKREDEEKQRLLTEAEKKRRKELEDFAKQQGWVAGAKGADLPSGTPPLVPSSAGGNRQMVDPATAMRMQQANEASVVAVADGKFFESYSGEVAQPVVHALTGGAAPQYSNGQGAQRRDAGVPQQATAPAKTDSADASFKQEAPPVVSPYPGVGARVVHEGTIIRSVLVTGIHSQLEGKVVARVIEDVYDTINSHHLLIPKGSRLVGAYKNQVIAGQERVGVSFKRILLTDGRSVVIPEMTGTDATGQSGFPGEYHGNWVAGLWPAALVGLIGAIIEPKQNTSSSTVIYTQPGAGGQNVVQQIVPEMSRRLMDRSSGAKPYITVPAGEAVAIVVSTDIAFPATGDQIKQLR
jgi:type IV secretory pathway VirB10-like protein